MGGFDDLPLNLQDAVVRRNRRAAIIGMLFIMLIISLLIGGTALFILFKLGFIL